MNNMVADEDPLQHLGQRFTELFLLLKDYTKTSKGLPILFYEIKYLRDIQHYIDNSIDILLQGLQEAALLLGFLKQDVRLNNAYNAISFFIDTICTLTQALNDLKSDADYALEQRGVSNY